MLRHLIGKLQKRLSTQDHHPFSDDDFEVPISVPDDVKKGHFAVLASKGLEKKRFVVKIDRLNSPDFLRLLEKAEQEYGFQQTGALMVPCTPQELEKILKI